MPFYRCKNYGPCAKANRREVFELPPGSPPICPEPGCGKPLEESKKIGDGEPRPGPGKRDVKRKGFPWLLIVLPVLLLALIAGVVWLLVVPDEPKSLTLRMPQQVQQRIGESVTVPITVEPAAAAFALSVANPPLPAGLLLDTPGKRIYGTAQVAGTNVVTIKASAAGYTEASATVSIEFAAVPPPISQTPSVTSPPAVTPPPPETYHLVLTGSSTIGGVDKGSQRGLARDLIKSFCSNQFPGGSLMEEKLITVPGAKEQERLISYKTATGKSSGS